jgi:hypothetical protein
LSTDFLTDLSFSSAAGCGGRGELPAAGDLSEDRAVTQRHHL